MSYPLSPDTDPDYDPYWDDRQEPDTRQPCEGCYYVTGGMQECDGTCRSAGLGRVRGDAPEAA